jgi:3',5'-cyclic AMP phosphodiesterase CpdA
MHRNQVRLAAALGATTLLAACGGSSDEAVQPPVRAASTKVAFISDVHFHDVYAKFGDGSFAGLPGTATGMNATIRSMYAQLTSTRLFNENYFAFVAALDDAVAKGIKLVVLPGDFSDDGQPVHMRGLKAIMDSYTEKHGIEFVVTFGNHDPNRPFTRAAGKSDYLGAGGQQQRIYSKTAVSECNDYSTASASKQASGAALPTVCTEEVREYGYKEVMESMRSFGAYPKQSYKYWESPYSSYKDQASYSYASASAEAEFARRQYEICLEGTGGAYKKPAYTKCLSVPDASFVVEPVEGVWLLSIDSNVYLPTASSDPAQPESAANFNGSGDAGWNKMITHKQHVVAWARDVAERARKSGKKLVTFGHYPMVEFYKDTNDQVAALFASNGLDLKRRPTAEATAAAAATGVHLNFAGHLHTNDTGVYKSGDQFLVNVQVPSMAAYVPAYKLATFDADDKVEIDTVVVRNVPRFNELFEHYAREHDYLKSVNSATIWNRDVLNAKTYREFASWHITELTRLRFLKSNWKCEMRTLAENLNAEQLLMLAVLNTPVTLEQMQAHKDIGITALPGCTTAAGAGATAPGALRFNADWEAAKVQASALASAQGITMQQLAAIPGVTVAADFHRLLNAGELAFEDLQERAPLYRALNAALDRSTATLALAANGGVSDQNSLGAVFQVRFKPMFAAMAKASTAPPNLHFVVDQRNKTVTGLSTGTLLLK